LSDANTNPLQLAEERLLAPAELQERHLDAALRALLRGGVETAELYFQVARHESWALEDGIVKEGTHSIERGVGVRAVAGEKTGFAYSDEIVAPALMAASQAAGAIVRQGRQGALAAWSPTGGQRLYPALDPIASLADDDRRRAGDRAGLFQRRRLRRRRAPAGAHERLGHRRRRRSPRTGLQRRRRALCLRAFPRR
jgi:TldD protein